MMILYFIFIFICVKKTPSFHLFREMANHYMDGTSPQTAFRIFHLLSREAQDIGLEGRGGLCFRYGVLLL